MLSFARASSRCTLGRAVFPTVGRYFAFGLGFCGCALSVQRVVELWVWICPTPTNSNQIEHSSPPPQFTPSHHELFFMLVAGGGPAPAVDTGIHPQCLPGCIYVDFRDFISRSSRVWCRLSLQAVLENSTAMTRRSTRTPRARGLQASHVSACFVDLISHST